MALALWLLPVEAGALINAGSLDTPGEASDVAVVGDLVYIADGEAGLRIADVSIAQRPTDLGFLDTPGTANDVELADGRAYIADGVGGLRIIDVSNPARGREAPRRTTSPAKSSGASTPRLGSGSREPGSWR